MKYGILTLKKPLRRSTDGCHNVGDNIQALAMREFYIKILGIPENEILDIDYHDLSTYSGDKVILPINFYFPSLKDAKETWFPTSDCINPIFTGLHLETQSLSKNDISYLKSNEPIGCRDEYTYRLMLNYGIKAYIGGCITTTLTSRNNKLDYSSTYIVDVCQDIESIIPQEYRNNIVYRSHEIIAPMNEEGHELADMCARKLLDEYRNNAKLVITSRLHCAAPCFAMGIPVILVLKEKKATFSWIDRLVPIYMEQDIKSIKFEIEKTPYHIKDLIIDCYKKRVLGIDSEREMNLLTDFFCSEAHIEYVSIFDKVKRRIDSIAKTKDLLTYAIWGATSLAEETYNYISDNYGSRIKLKLFVDEYNDVMFHNLKSQVFDSCDLGNIDFWVITPAHARDEIEKRFIGKKHDGVIIWYDGSII